MCVCVCVCGRGQGDFSSLSITVVVGGGILNEVKLVLTVNRISRTFMLNS